MFLKFHKIPEITSAIEFLFTEAGANSLPTHLNFLALQKKFVYLLIAAITK